MRKNNADLKFPVIETSACFQTLHKQAFMKVCFYVECWQGEAFFSFFMYCTRVHSHFPDPCRSHRVSQ